MRRARPTIRNKESKEHRALRRTKNTFWMHAKPSAGELGQLVSILPGHPRVVTRYFNLMAQNETQMSKKSHFPNTKQRTHEVKM